MYLHACEKKETLLQNQSIRQRLLQIVILKSLPQQGYYCRKLIQHLSVKQSWIIIKVFSSNSCQVSSFISWGFFSLLSGAFFNLLWKDGVHPNLPPVEIDDAIELLNIEFDFRYLQVILLWCQLLVINLYALIPIVVISGEDAPRPDRLERAADTNHKIY